MPPATRRLMTFFIMSAAVMNQLDTTIANVALPHIQGSTSASREQIGWVLTSYIVSMAIFTPLTGWLASKFGRRRLVLTSIFFFTVASGLCGIATNLHELILFRIFQGIAGSSLVPMSQATLLDSYPSEEHGRAMTLFGLAAITGPLIGPLAGGWLTENASWRWCFLINLPVGAMAWFGLSALMPESTDEDTPNLDFTGFALLALGIGATQLLLDRGQILDWFQSTEIWLEATLAATCLYLFVVHSLTHERPFLRLEIFKDRNFVICSAVGFFLGVLIYSPMALLPQMLEGLMGYPTMEVGLTLAPRGLGVLVAMVVLNRIISKVDFRMMIAFGMLANAFAMYQMSHMSLQADNWIIITSGIIQGIGSSVIFVPLSAMAFSTLPTKFRNEATALNTLLRNYGAAVGIATLQAMTVRNTAIAESRLTENLRPDNPAVAAALPNTDFSRPEAASRMTGEVIRQATMISYIEAFQILFVIAMLATSIVFLLRPTKRQ